MIWPFQRKKSKPIEPSDRWYVEIDDHPVAIIDNPVDAEMYWFKWQLHSMDDADTPPDLWDYSMDARRSFRHVATNERNRCTIPAGKGAVLPDGRVLLRGPFKGSDNCERKLIGEPSIEREWAITPDLKSKSNATAAVTLPLPQSSSELNLDA